MESKNALIGVVCDLDISFKVDYSWIPSWTELEALWTSAALAWDLVLGEADGPSSLAMSLSMVVEEVGCRINTATANGVPWGTRSVLSPPYHILPN
jgi:hypothetical protein